MKQKLLHNNIKLILVMLFWATALSFVSTSLSASKFVASDTQTSTINAHNFYFYSDKLTTTTGNTTFSTSVDFNLYNYDGSNISSYAIAYSISIENIVPSTFTQNNFVVLDNKNGSLTANEKAIANVTVAPQDASISSFNIKVSTTNAYAKTISAKCNKLYAINYSLDGGTNHASNPSTYTIEDEITLLAATKPECNFVNWYADAGLSVAFSGIAVGTTGDITVYAKWTPIGALPAPSGYVYFGEYPQTQKASSVNITATQDSRGYFLGDDGSYYAAYNAKYYKVEPILWKILQDKNGELFIHATAILLSRRFDASTNVYNTSEIRAWLIGEFYNQVFSAAEKLKIQNSHVETGDKVFLLSFEELLDSRLGLHIPAQRYRDFTPYSAPAASWINRTWWTRSPYPVNGYARFVDPNNDIANYSVNSYYIGVVPALKIKLPKA